MAKGHFFAAEAQSGRLKMSAPGQDGGRKRDLPGVLIYVPSPSFLVM